jgi:uncharacterized membrane protein YqjE
MSIEANTRTGYDLTEHRTRGEQVTDASTGELVRQASEQVSRLVRDELRLAQLEMTAKGKQAGRGVGLFGAAGVVALFGVLALVLAAISALALVMPGWAAALIVGVILLAVAGFIALAGRQQVSQATPFVPRQAVAHMREDIGEIRERTRR